MQPSADRDLSTHAEAATSYGNLAGPGVHSSGHLRGAARHDDTRHLYRVKARDVLDYKSRCSENLIGPGAKQASDCQRPC